MMRASLLLSVLASAAILVFGAQAAHSQGCGFGMIPGPSDSSILPMAIGGVINNPLMTGTELGGGGYGGPGGCGGGYGGNYGGPGGCGGGYGGNYGGPGGGGYGGNYGGPGGGGYGGNYGGPGGCGGGGGYGGAYTGNYNYLPNPGTNGSYMTTGSTGSYLSNPNWSSSGTASNGGTMSTANNGGYGTLFSNTQNSNSNTGNIFYPNGTYTGSSQTAQRSSGTGLGNGVQNGSSSSSSKTGYMLPFAPLPTSGNPTPQASKFAGTSETTYQMQSYSRQPYNVTGATE